MTDQTLDLDAIEATLTDAMFEAIEAAAYAEYRSARGGASGQILTARDHIEWYISKTAIAHAYPALTAEVRKLREALAEIADPQPTFAGPDCCAGTFSDACELFGDIARKALKPKEPSA